MVMNDKSEVDLTDEDSECTENEHEFILSDAAPDALTVNYSPSIVSQFY